MAVPELLVLRHGETEWNRAGRWQGDLDSPLTEVGRDQARGLGRILRRAGVGPATHDFLTSPLGRARHTAQIVAEATDGIFAEDARLREISVGRWTGWDVADIRKEAGIDKDAPFLDLYTLAPDGEPFATVWERCAGVLSTLSRPTVIVTHGITSRFLRAIAMDMSLSDLGKLPGGQGIVHRVRYGHHETIELE